MAKGRKAKYTGVLATPIVITRSFGTDITALGERVSALYKLYKIDSKEVNAHWKLAMALAHDHVPGFQILPDHQKGIGRPKRWNLTKGFLLYLDVRRLFQKQSVANRCRLLIKRPGYEGQTAENLRRRYNEVCKTHPDVVALESRRRQGDPVDDWIISAFEQISRVGRKTE